MAFSQIPMPKQSNIFEGLVQQYLQQKQLQQNQQQINQQGQYQQGQLGLEKQRLAIDKLTSDRANTLLQYQIQSYQDTHKEKASAQKINDMMNNAYLQAFHEVRNSPLAQSNSNISGSPTQNLPSANPGMLNQSNQNNQPTQQNSPNSLSMIKSLIGQPQQNNQSPTNPANQQIPPMVPQQMSSQNQVQQQPIAMPNKNINPLSSPQMNAQQPQPQLSSQQVPVPQMAMPKFGEELTVKAGNPALYNLDKKVEMFQNVPGSPFKIAEKDLGNGMIQRTYPSQRVTIQNLGSSISPEEKTNIDIKSENIKEQNKANIKRSEEYLDAGDIIDQYTKNLETIYNLLNKNSFSTGNIAGLRNLFHFSSEDQGRFNAAAIPLVGKLSKDVSTRGGAVVAQMVSPAKPGIWRGYNENLGLVKENIESFINAYHDAKNNYEEINNKPYPKKMPEFLKQYEKTMNSTSNNLIPPQAGMVRVVLPNKKLFDVPEKQVDILLKENPTIKRVK